MIGLAAGALAVLAAWLAFDNPEIDRTGRGDDYQCLAPWDTVLNDADNVPDGEPPPDAAQIGSRCRDSGQDRVDRAVVVVAGAAGSAALGAVIGLAHSSRREQA